MKKKEYSEFGHELFLHLIKFVINDNSLSSKEKLGHIYFIMKLYEK